MGSSDRGVGNVRKDGEITRFGREAGAGKLYHVMRFVEECWTEPPILTWESVVEVCDGRRGRGQGIGQR